MKERGMIFNGEMVRAIIDGRKIQTRRIMKPQPANDIARGTFPNTEAYGLVSTMKHKFGSTTAHLCPFGQPGVRIWVRETFRVHSRATDVATLVYKSSERQSWTEQTHRVPVSVCNKPAVIEKWTPSIHMPRWASRILLEITDVRVERLNSISEEEARSEGVGRLREGFWKNYQPGWTQHQISARGSFATLWDSIYGSGEWDRNPWVWVITFKCIDGAGHETD
ncbi:hypothetical protein [Enterobacter hormaechei]|uniref:hypothetical protein n=1 Tax=Enterobacter hormaechei TaxID=158836 RepID=UPI0039C62FE5